jgi:hypothetical protein
MKEPPNNLLKTNGQKSDPNELLKIKELSCFGDMNENKMGWNRESQMSNSEP